MHPLTVYNNLPIVMQDVACNLAGALTNFFRFNSSFDTILAQVEKLGDLSREEWQHVRDCRLRHFIRHCATTVPYYRKLFRDLNISHEDINTIDDLGALPIISKQTVLENASQ